MLLRPSPTRAALMSGHWTNRTGAWHTIMGRSMLREDEGTLGQFFKDAGYQTGMFGKWHLGDNFPYRPEDRGFEEVYRHGGGGVGQTPDVWDNSYFDGGATPAKDSWKVSCPQNKPTLHICLVAVHPMNMYRDSLTAPVTNDDIDPVLELGVYMFYLHHR